MSDQIIPTPGLHKRVRFDEYCRWDAVNNSLLGDFSISAKAVRWAMMRPAEDTKATLIGHASHSAVLEPDIFKSLYAVAPKVDGRTIAGKAALKDFREANAGKIEMTEDEYGDALALARVIMEHPYAGRLITGRGQSELSVVWKDAATEILCKCRIDRFTETPEGWPCIADIKTTRSTLNRHGIAKAVHEYGYHRQAAMNLRGLNAQARGDRKFILIFASKVIPFDVACYELEPEAIAQGEREIESYLRRYKACVESGRWPGVSDELESISLPTYALDPVL